MKNIATVILALQVFVTSIFAQYAPPANYYSSAAGLTGTALKNALHNIIDDHTVIPYSSSAPDVWDALSQLDQDPDNPNNILCIYANRSIPKAWQDGGTVDPYEWNREHAWPKSSGFDVESYPAYTDLHHLFAAQDNYNSARGNKIYDNGGTTVWDTVNSTSDNRTDSDSWEPWDGVKGDLARAMFYMAVRYNGDKSNEPDLELDENVVNVTNTRKMGKLSTLLQWNVQDPVDDAERARNHLIYTNWQHNRNPFVDHPEWVQAIWGGPTYPGSGGTTPPSVITLTSGVSQSASVSAGQWNHYKIVLPTNATGLSIVMSGTGDADLYSKYNAQPTSTSYDFRPYLNGSAETITYNTVTPGGTYYISVYGYASSSSYTLTATVKTAASGGSATLTLVRCLPNPYGSDTYTEAVEIKNEGTTTVSLTGWRLTDAANGANWSTFTGTISPGQSKTFTRANGTGMVLNNSGGETVKLVNPSGVTVDTIVYTTAAEGVWYY